MSWFIYLCIFTTLFAVVYASLGFILSPSICFSSCVTVGFLFLILYFPSCGYVCFKGRLILESFKLDIKSANGGIFLLAGDTELLKLLVSRGLDVNLQSDAGTPLIWAAGHGQQDAVRILLEHHANVSVICFLLFFRFLLCLKSPMLYVDI